MSRNTRRVKLAGRESVSYHGMKASGVSSGRTATMATVCIQCEKTEAECTCEKYCSFCQSQFDIHLCMDGIYYCPDCREACDIRRADTDDR